MEKLVVDKERAAAFKRDILEVCSKHELVMVPTFDGEPSAHDSMLIIPITDDWKKFVEDEAVITDERGDWFKC